MSGGARSETHVLRVRLRRRRRWVGVLALLGPTLWLLATDVSRRSDHLLTFDRMHALGYLGSFVASGVFWAVLLYNAARLGGRLRRAAAGLFITLYLLMVGVQAAFHQLFNIYLSHDGQIYSRSLAWSLVGHLPPTRPTVVAQLLFHLALAIAFVLVARRYVRPRRWPRRIAVVLVPVALYAMARVPASYRMWQSSSPDTIYAHGLMAVLKERLRYTQHAPELRVQRRRPTPVPPLRAAPSRPRNVLFVLQESLRYDVVCNAYDPKADCATPFSNRAVPERYPLDQMRANAATTAISISNLWSGVASTESLEVLLSVPLLWDYAAAAGYHAQYWTSQNVMFGSMRLYVQDFPVTHYAYATNLDSQAHYDAGAYDRLLTDRVIADWDSVQEPFMGVVHYSNVHFPYVYDEEHAPFQPDAFDKSADKNDEFFNYYKNVAYLSDRAVGRLLEHVRASDKGKRTVIIYTADHGESFREHWQLGHTSSIYDEEVKVPGWIDAPDGTLSSDESHALKQARDEFVFHYDVAPTILDLMGVWDEPALRPFRTRMLGNPLIRPERTVRPVPLSNCSWLWECGFRNWGMMQGSMKVEAREWNKEFHCFDLAADPLEEVNLGEAACAPLPDRAREMFGPMPFEEWPVGKNVLWGAAPEPQVEQGS